MIAAVDSTQLPTRLSPARQETLASFVQRCADANGIPVSLLLKGCQELVPEDLTKHEKLLLSELACRLGVSEDALDAMSPHHRLELPAPRLEGVLKGTRWVCSECEAFGIGTHSERTWLRFVCEEHAVFLQVSTMAPHEPVAAGGRALVLQTRANHLFRNSYEAYEAGVQLLSIMKQLRRLSVLMKTYEVLPETLPILSWLEKVQITQRNSVQTPKRVAILLSCLLPMVLCHGFGAAMERNLRVLCERPASTSGYLYRELTDRRQASKEVSRLMRIGRAVTELVDARGLCEDDVPATYLAKSDPDWRSLHSGEPHIRRAAADMWVTRMHACHDIREYVDTYRNGPKEQKHAKTTADRCSRQLPLPIGESPVSSTEFAVEMTQMLRQESMNIERSGIIGLPIPAVKWLMPEIGASQKARVVLEHWLWIQGPVQEPRFWMDRPVPLEDIWQIDARMTVEKKLQALELRDSVIAEVERRGIRQNRGESTSPEPRRSQYQVG